MRLKACPTTPSHGFDGLQQTQRGACVALYMLILCFCLPATLTAQTISMGTKLLRDDIPATLQESHLGVSYAVGKHLGMRSTYTYIFADQEEFQGLPRLRPAVHQFEQVVATGIPALRLGLHASGTLTRTHTGAVMGDFSLGARYTEAWPLRRRGAPLRLSVRAEGGRARYTDVSTAIWENVHAWNATTEMDFNFMDYVQLVGNAQREWFGDGNRRDAAYAYALLHLVKAPKLSVGYAWSWADSRESTWRMTGSTFDPASRQFNYQYFYYPYFTPLRERGHQILAMVQWALTYRTLLHAKVSIPFSSRGEIQYMPESGPTPVPIDYDVRYEMEDLVPTQYEGGLMIRAWEPLTIDIGVQYFSKPYYEYLAGHLTLLFAPF